MKICPKCGNQCNDTDGFCFMCGTKFEVPKEPEPKKQMKFCMCCGKELIPGAAFCMECGTPVGSVGKSQPVVEHQRRQVLMGGSGAGMLDEDATVAVRGAQTRNAVKYPDRDSSTVSLKVNARNIPVPNVPAAPDPGVPAASVPTGNSSTASQFLPHGPGPRKQAPSHPRSKGSSQSASQSRTGPCVSFLPQEAA